MRCWMLRLLFSTALLVLFSCAGSDWMGGGEGGEGSQGSPSSIRAVIRRTSHGVPHITAANYRGLGAGLGYSQAQDAVCILADQFLKVRGERARYFGPGLNEVHINSDLNYKGLGLLVRAQAAYALQTSAMKDLLEGFAAGYNHYLEQTPAQSLPAPCRGAAWVKPIRGVDLLAYHLDLAMLDSTVPLLGALSKAQPPLTSGARTPVGTEDAPLEPRPADLGSNGWAVGRDRSTTGRGLLLANPHFPWEGALRFYESHLTLPGTLDVYGGSLLGMPVINIGFNRHVAWTHTVTTASHFVLYRLTLVDGDPTRYVYDGQPRAMIREQHVIEVLQPDGSVRPVTRTFWRSHYGPMLGGSSLPWGTRTAYTIRDANENNHRFAEQWLRMNQAQDLNAFADVDREVRGVPWVNTLAVSADGTASYVDASRVPRLSADTVAAYQQSLQRDADTQALAAQRIVLLDGSKSRDEWVGSSGVSAGLVPVENMPRLSRADFVMNANDTARYTNPAAPLPELPFPYELRAPGLGRLSPRTHMNLALLTERGASSASGDDGRFTRDELEHALFDNRSWVAEQLRDPVVKRCLGVESVRVEGKVVRLVEACRALATWDGRFDAERTGALVWREFLGRFSAVDLVDKGPLFARPFDSRQPLTTPAGLTPAPDGRTDPILEKLGEALLRLQEAGFDAKTRLGEAQFTRKGTQVIALHGGVGDEGLLNVVGYTLSNSTLLPRTTQGTVISDRTGLTAEGYPVNNGSSFMLLTEFARSGPRAAALLTYSESADPASPLYADQTSLFAQKRLRPVLFEEADIQRDPALQTTRLDFEYSGH
jgi:acyl-homoserine-lactone acylase